LGNRFFFHGYAICGVFEKGRQPYIHISNSSFGRGSGVVTLCAAKPWSGGTYPMKVPIDGDACLSTSPEPAPGDDSAAFPAQITDSGKPLTTLQRNALCKLLDRPHFTPEDVVRLGYRRLAQAEGIGRKSLAAILAWLRTHGYELEPDAGTTPMLPRPFRGGRGLASALKLLRHHGYVVLPPRPDSGAEPLVASAKQPLPDPISK
jgi:hypothetical protein